MTFKVGDTVKCRWRGKGHVTRNDAEGRFPIEVTLGGGTFTYTVGGHYFDRGSSFRSKTPDLTKEVD